MSRRWVKLLAVALAGVLVVGAAFLVHKVCCPGCPLMCAAPFARHSLDHRSAPASRESAGSRALISPIGVTTRGVTGEVRHGSTPRGWWPKDSDRTARKSWRSGFVTTWSLWWRVPAFGSTSIPEPGRAMARATSVGRRHFCSTSWPRGLEVIRRRSAPATSPRWAQLPSSCSSTCSRCTRSWSTSSSLMRSRRMVAWPMTSRPIATAPIAKAPNAAAPNAAANRDANPTDEAPVDVAPVA